MKKYFPYNGFTIVELIIVIAIMGLFLIVASYQFGRWMRRFNIEKDIREMHIDLLYARKIAMNRNITQFFNIDALVKKSYEVVEDRNRNETLDSSNCQTGNDCAIISYQTKYPIDASNGFTLSFDNRGIGGENTFCIFSDVSPNVDCIVISNTRINIGKIINQSGGCKSENCRQK